MENIRQRVKGAILGRSPRQADGPQQSGVAVPPLSASSGEQMPHKQQYLAEIDIFCDLSPEDMDHLAKTTTMVTAEKGKIFYYPREAGEVVFLLKRGRVQLYRLSPEGRKLVIATLSAGSVFGEMSLLGQGMHDTFAEAVEDCLICVMSREEMIQLLSEKPQVALRILDILGKRLRLAEDQLEDVAFRKVPERLALTLLRLAGVDQEDQEGDGSAEPSGEPKVITGLTHQELADMLGTHRETVSFTLNDFKARGLVDLAPKRITLLNVDGLRALCGE